VREFLANSLSLIIFLTSIFMILLILIQRGRGGGLIGALGGAGGSSPFGSRAGDTFTRVTLVTAGVWIFLIMLQILVRPV
jgi:preprotein translocase subunit SecG